MQAGSVGADIDLLRGLATKFDQQATTLAALTKDLQDETDRSMAFWQGNFSDQFRAAWADANRTFQQMTILLHDASKNLNQNAQNIAQVTGS